MSFFAERQSPRRGTAAQFHRSLDWLGLSEKQPRIDNYHLNTNQSTSSLRPIKAVLSVIICGIVLVNCTKDSSNFVCDQQVIISESQYNSARTDQFNTDSMKIVGDCLKLKIGASGCNGESWVVKLIDSGLLLESNPPQRNLIISFENGELCNAVIGKEMSFDISSLQVEGTPVKLNITNTGDQLLYVY